MLQALHKAVSFLWEICDIKFQTLFEQLTQEDCGGLSADTSKVQGTTKTPSPFLKATGSLSVVLH